MEIRDNEMFGKSVFLVEGDDLSHVPATHGNLVTTSIREAFSAPKAYFENLSICCPFPEMAAWLLGVIAANEWQLELHLSGDHCSAGFRWRGARIRSAMVGLPVEQPVKLWPSALLEYYSLVDEVRWNHFGWGGGLEGVHSDFHSPLSDYEVTYFGDDIDPARTFIWGHTDVGDNLIFTSDGRGGWMNHGSHQIHLLGSIGDTINWVFAKLRANRDPYWDHESWDKKPGNKK